MNKRPLPVILIAVVYIAMGIIGLAVHFKDFEPRHPFPYDLIGITLIQLIAIVCGVYLLRGRDWARWLALAWMLFHVILSIFHTLPELAIHIVFCAVIGWCLFNPVATRYFRLAVGGK